MANRKHLTMLRRGVKVWNEWRIEANQLEADLSQADLENRNLLDFDLSFVDFTRARLAGAGLIGVDLSLSDLTLADLRNSELIESNLRLADLTGTNLQGAHLQGAKLLNADLTAANLSGASLKRADLSEAKLDGTNLRKATLGYTILGDNDLSAAKGLASVLHDGPSYIGIQTIYRSQGKIPESFLRGCGVPDNFIEFARSLVANPIQFYSCFISHSSKDTEFVERLYADLQTRGVRCWFAPEDLKTGDPFRQRIDEAIRLREKLMIVLSEHSVQSPWVEKEVETAFEEERKRQTTVLFPIRLDDSVLDTTAAWAADIRRTRHIGNFTNWEDHDFYQQALRRLLRDLKSESKLPKRARGRRKLHHGK